MPITPVQDAAAELDRLSTLQGYAVIDTVEEKEFTTLAIKAAELCEAPSAAISFIDTNRCWLKARVGFVDPQIPRELSFCRYTFGSSAIFVVPDAAADVRFQHIPLVAELRYRFYAGAPLIAPNGHTVGALSVADFTPRHPTQLQLDGLRSLATQIVALLETRRQDLRPAPPVDVSPNPPPPRRTVLVVDDEPYVRQLIVHVLERFRIAVIEAEDGAQGLATYRTKADAIGLVLTDLQMPVLDGLGLIRALQEEPNPPLVAAMSGRLDHTVRAQLAAEGTEWVLSKPFGLEAITQLVGLLPA